MNETTLTLPEMKALVAKCFAMAEWIEGNSGIPFALTSTEWIATLRGMAKHHGFPFEDSK